ncbi:MAG TPA: ABC transporter substrate-binding protein, partial [Gammaproteobacteria bacterium]|nr:ABC transporter substrate-binding protein [Gammaproteobacteria bacterium]
MNALYRGILLSCLGITLGLGAWAGEASHGFAYFGNLKYSADMPHFDYVNPNAPKGGLMRGGDTLQFNNLNHFADKGTLAWYADSLIFEPLMMQSDDEIASYYGRLAKTIQVADDYAWVEYS